MPNAFASGFRRMTNRVASLFDNASERPSDSASTQSLVEVTQMTSTSHASRSGTVSNDYTELMGGSVPCPSCKGSGRIPKEMEEQLVALIPVNDDRLKPKRTWMWVLAGISICMLLAAIAIFMLVPRTVQLSSNGAPVQLVHVFDRDSKNFTFIKFHFMNVINVTNRNYYSVTVLNSSVQIISKFQPFTKDWIGNGGNDTSMTVAPLSSNNNQLYFNSSVELRNYSSQYCQSPYSALTSLYVSMQFDVTVMLEYLGHTEQVALRTLQPVCCIPTGSCTTY